MTHRFVHPIRVTLESPFLMRGLGAVGFGIDTAQIIDARGHAIIPGDQMRGLLRHALLHLAKRGLLAGSEVEKLLGHKSTDGRDTPARARVLLSDLSADRPVGRTGDAATRVRIDDGTGAADEGSLQVIELPHPIGDRVTFSGTVTLFWEAGDADRVIGWLRKALALVPAVGAFKSAGFGLVAEAALGPARDRRPVAAPDTVFPRGDRLRLTLRFDRPLLVDAEQVADNVYRGAAVIPGGVIKGALARALAPGSCRLDGELGSALAGLRIGHGYPRRDGASRPFGRPLPFSVLVGEDGSVHDALLAKAPVLPGGRAPKFETDWKDADRDRVALALDLPEGDVASDLRTHTAIMEGGFSAKDGDLFSYAAVLADGLSWVAEIERAEADPKAFDRLMAVLESGLDGVGKTEASTTSVELDDLPAPSAEPVAGHDGFWAITLDTPALLNDPRPLLENKASLHRDYAAYWSEVSEGRLQLVRFFARQRLFGGYLGVRYRLFGDSVYYPWLATLPGSVFLLKGDGRDLLDGWLSGGLPIRSSLGIGAADWRSCPFLPRNGYGAIRLNAVDHPALCHGAPDLALPIGEAAHV